MTAVTVIVPTYNERDNLEPLFEGIFAAVPDINVLVVDDNSPDGTAQMVRTLQERFPRVRLLSRARKEGLGPAYREAFKYVLKDPSVKTIIMMDADLSHDPASLPALLRAREFSHVAIGSRYIPEGKLVGWEWWRRILSRGGNWYARVITRIPVHDCTGGFNAISTEVLRKVDLSGIASGYAFQIGLKFVLWKHGAKFAEVPITFRNRRSGESKLTGHIVLEAVTAPWRLLFRL